MDKHACRYWNKANPVFWVASLKGKAGDWGYTTIFEEAIPLSPYWQRRFAADCRDIGEQVKFVPVRSETT